MEKILNHFKKIFSYIYWLLEETRGKKRLEKIYDNLSKNNKYDYLINYEKRLKGLKKALTFIHQPYKKNLDIACGTGVFIDAFPDKSIQIVGFDNSEGMLDNAKKRFKNFPNISFQKGDFMSVKFPPSSFDLITISNSIRFVPKGMEKEFEKNIASWLTEKGTFLIVQALPFYQIINIPFINNLYKGFNANLCNEKSIEHAFASYLKLYNKQTIGYQSLHKIVAFYFKKI